LKPKEDEVISQPWQWPINYRVSVYFIFELNKIWVSQWYNIRLMIERS